MKFIVTTVLFLAFILGYTQPNEIPHKNRFTATFGILQGSGSLLGLDAEAILFKGIGIQLGAGIIGGGGALTFHLKDDAQSSYFTLSCWNQGIGYSYKQSIIGSTFVYRGKKWFTFQVGAGVKSDSNKSFNRDLLLGYVIPKIAPMCSIGIYHVFRK